MGDTHASCKEQVGQNMGPAVLLSPGPLKGPVIDVVLGPLLSPRFCRKRAPERAPSGILTGRAGDVGCAKLQNFFP